MSHVLIIDTSGAKAGDLSARSENRENRFSERGGNACLISLFARCREELRRRTELRVEPSAEDCLIGALEQAGVDCHGCLTGGRGKGGNSRSLSEYQEVGRRAVFGDVDEVG